MTPLRTPALRTVAGALLALVLALPTTGAQAQAEPGTARSAVLAAADAYAASAADSARVASAARLDAALSDLTAARERRADAEAERDVARDSLSESLATNAALRTEAAVADLRAGTAQAEADSLAAALTAERAARAALLDALRALLRTADDAAGWLGVVADSFALQAGALRSDYASAALPDRPVRNLAGLASATRSVAASLRARLDAARAVAAATARPPAPEPGPDAPSPTGPTVPDLAAYDAALAALAPNATSPNDRTTVYSVGSSLSSTDPISWAAVFTLTSYAQGVIGESGAATGNVLWLASDGAVHYDNAKQALLTSSAVPLGTPVLVVATYVRGGAVRLRVGQAPALTATAASNAAAGGDAGGFWGAVSGAPSGITGTPSGTLHRGAGWKRALTEAEVETLFSAYYSAPPDTTAPDPPTIESAAVSDFTP